MDALCHGVDNRWSHKGSCLGNGSWCDGAGRWHALQDTRPRGHTGSWVIKVRSG